MTGLDDRENAQLIDILKLVLFLRRQEVKDNFTLPVTTVRALK